MVSCSYGSLHLYHWRLFLPYEKRVVAGVSSRLGGISDPPWRGLNLGLQSGDNPVRVEANRRALCRALGMPFCCYTGATQIHSRECHVVREALAGAGRKRTGPALPPGDALVTEIPEILLVLLFADCVPIVLYDPRHHIGAVCHAGWRGTASGIVSHCVARMRTLFQSDPAELVAGIGPSIGPCCYAVGEEVYHAVAAATKGEVGEVSKLDLKEANFRQLLASGLLSHHIERSSLCTSCSCKLFFSYRKEGPQSGRFGAFLLLR